MTYLGRYHLAKNLAVTSHLQPIRAKQQIGSSAQEGDAETPPPQVLKIDRRIEEESTNTTAAAVSSQLVSMPSMRRSRRAGTARAAAVDGIVEWGLRAGEGVAVEEHARKRRRVWGGRR